MTKTQIRKLVTELRNNASYVTNIATNELMSDAQKQWRIVDALNNIDGISAQLREALVDEES